MNQKPKLPYHLTKISKRMSYILRHGLDDYQKQYKVYPNWSVSLSDLANFMETTEELIKEVSDTNEKKRFEILNYSGIQVIRASQGHSQKIADMFGSDEQLLETLTNPLDVCIHGTNKKAYESIKKTGLSKMDRNYIHMCSGPDAISGYRASSNVHIYINMAKAMGDGIVFKRSANGVILSEGINGTIDPKYFAKVNIV